MISFFYCIIWYCGYDCDICDWPMTFITPGYTIYDSYENHTWYAIVLFLLSSKLKKKREKKRET